MSCWFVIDLTCTRPAGRLRSADRHLQRYTTQEKVRNCGLIRSAKLSTGLAVAPIAADCSQETPFCTVFCTSPTVMQP